MILLKLQIDNNEIESENSMTLLGITIDNRFSFDDHISKLCNKQTLLKKYMSQKELEVVLNSFLYIPISITILFCSNLVVTNLLKKLKTYISAV